jgi:drug/metabolite transporter (DMT)-like permease
MNIFLFTLPTVLLQIGVTDPDRYSNFLLLGYVVMAVIAIAYLLYLYNLQRNATQDLQVLRQLLEEERQ